MTAEELARFMHECAKEIKDDAVPVKGTWDELLPTTQKRYLYVAKAVLMRLGKKEAAK